jgi:hypothetical protein
MLRPWGWACSSYPMRRRISVGKWHLYLGNVTVRGEKDGKSKGVARWPTVCLSMYSITENIYYSQLSSCAIVLQPECNCFTSYNTRKGLCYLSLCAIVLRSPPPSHVSTCNGQRSSQLFCVHYTIEKTLGWQADWQGNSLWEWDVAGTWWGSWKNGGLWYYQCYWNIWVSPYVSTRNSTV